MLDIIYRVCETRDGTHCGNRPEWFSKEKCLYSFFNAVENAKDLVSNVIFIHDGQMGPLFDIIQQYEHVKTYHGNYFDSLMEAYNLASSLDSDLYFVEDDYLHLPDSVRKVALAVPNFKLISPYDHLARYNPVKYTGKQDSHYELKITFDETSNHHWRTNESACHTYAIDNKTFKDYYDTITSQNCVAHDQNLFISMYHHGHSLWTPITGLVTQVDPYMSPGVDWETYNRIF